MKARQIIFLASLMLAVVATAATKPRIYMNAGHGSWGPTDRPMATIPYPMLPETGRPDTCGFYESNTNLWKVMEMGRILKETGQYYLKYSRKANGPYPYVSGASDAERYNRSLPVISAEVDSWRADYFISVHSNAATEGALINYPLFLYRGTDAENAVNPSREICTLMWPFHVEAMKAGFEFQNYYNSSTNVRGDRDFYHYTWENTKGYLGYLGVLMHSSPGYLVEGYFHTYQPSRHRALNADWCRMEGRRYARGIIDYFGTTADTLGCIMGAVRCKEKSTNDLELFNHPDDNNDAYLPLNGAKIRLKDANSNILKVYDVDKNYNGIFVFTDLQPGIYYIDLYCPGYKTQQTRQAANRYVVKANQTTYKTHFMTAGVSVNLVGPKTNEEIEQERLNPLTEVSADETPLVSRNTVSVYDLSGRLVMQTTRRQLESASIPAGVYTLESNGRSVKYYKK